MSVRVKTTLNTTANRLRTSVGIVLLVATSLAAGTARAADPGTIAYTQSCDGQSLTLTVTATGEQPYEILQFSLLVDPPVTWPPPRNRSRAMRTLSRRPHSAGCRRRTERPTS